MSEDRLPKVAIWEPAVSSNDKVHERNKKPMLNDLKNKHKSIEVRVLSELFDQGCLHCFSYFFGSSLYMLTISLGCWFSYGFKVIISNIKESLLLSLSLVGEVPISPEPLNRSSEICSHRIIPESVIVAE